MSRKTLRFWHRIPHFEQSAPFRVYRRLLGLVLLGLLALITAVCVPALSAQQFEEISEVSSEGATADSLLQQGISLYDAEQFSQATGVWQQASAAFVAQGDSLNQALALRYLSLAYQHLGEWSEAESAIANSLELLNYSKNTADPQAYSDVSAKVLNTQGRLQAVKGQWSEALETWKRATAAYKQAGNQTGMIGTLINQAEALQALGLSSQAEAELLQIEQILQQQSDPELKAMGWQSLGKALRRVGELTKAKEILQKSLVAAQDYHLSNSRGSALLELGNTERDLGKRALAIGKKAEEQKHQQAAIAFYQQAANSPPLQLPAQLNLLSLFVETGKWSEAAQLGATIQPLIVSLPPSRTNIYARLNFAQSLTKLRTGEETRSTGSSSASSLQPHSYASIAEMLATAVQQAQSLQDRAAESYALGQLGGLYELTKQWPAAQDLTQQALLLTEEMQSPDIRYQWEWQLGRLEEKQGNIKEAIAAYEATVETLKSVRNNLLTINSDVQFSFRDNVEPIHRKLVDLLFKSEGNSQPSPENLQRITEVIDSLQLAELENFLSCSLSQKVQLNQDIDKVDQNAAFIYPIILEDRLEVIAKLPGGSFNHYMTPVNQTDVERTALELRASIIKPNQPEVVIEKATQVYEWLISPLEQDLENNSAVKTLVFVLDGVLRNIPISVLYDGKRQEYLMQKPYALALVPGLQLFDLRPLQREQLKVLLSGVSEQREVEGRPFPPLPNVVEELQGIGDLISFKLLLNSEFTEANLQQQINSGAFSVVHIATHGNFSSDPEETFILTYDQLLKSNDLNNLLRINNQNSSNLIELLVLSACNTAKGDNRATLGLAGIAVRAGARSTLSTLWSVSDRSTAELMEQFYKELTQPEVTKAEALHQAQLALFEQYKAPYYWAPYVLVGNWL